MGAPLNLIGEHFGRLTVLEKAPNRIYNNGDSRRAWLCSCSCGKQVIATTMDLRCGDTKSCGCLLNETRVKKATTHGHSGTRLHHIWVAMRKRCHNKHSSDYQHYGGRGISVCDEWDNSYQEFMDWALRNGYSDDLTIDRIDVDGWYTPSNCRWVSMREQANNRTTSKYITYNGETHTISEWSRITAIRYSTIYYRVCHGWDAERIFADSTKINQFKSNS